MTAGIDRPPDAPRLRFRLDHVVRYLLWAGLLVPWTWVLLIPVPPAAVKAVGGSDMSFILSKTLHFGVYAALAFLTAWLPLGRKWRIILLVMLIGHGGTTEFLQQFVQRNSSYLDFGRDSLGIGLGCLLSWRRWRA